MAFFGGIYEVYGGIWTFSRRIWWTYSGVMGGITVVNLFKIPMRPISSGITSLYGIFLFRCSLFVNKKSKKNQWYCCGCGGVVVLLLWFIAAQIASRNGGIGFMGSLGVSFLPIHRVRGVYVLWLYFAYSATPDLGDVA